MTCFIGGLGSGRLMVGLDDSKGPFQPNLILFCSVLSRPIPSCAIPSHHVYSEEEWPYCVQLTVMFTMMEIITVSIKKLDILQQNKPDNSTSPSGMV